MASKLEEVVLYSKRFDPEDLLPDREKSFFYAGARRHVSARPRFSNVSNPRKGVDVHLAVQSQRQFAEMNKDVGNRLGYDAFTEPVPQLFVVYRLAGDIVCDQTLVASLIFSKKHDAVSDVLVLVKSDLDFVELDAIAVELHLFVFAAKIFKLARRQHSAHIAGLVHQLAGKEWILDEAFGRKLVLVQIAFGKSRARDVDFTGYILRGWKKRFVENVDPCIRGRSSDRYESANIRDRIKPVVHASHRCFRGAVFINDLDGASEALVYFPRKTGFERLSAYDQSLDPAVSIVSFPDELEMAGRDLDDLNPVVLHDLFKKDGLLVRPVNHNAVSADKRNKYRRNRQVKRER